MNRNSNILQELQELSSPLAEKLATTPYTLPNGYFNGLAEQVLRRVKAMDAVSANDEITILSPVLNNISRQMPYQIPAGYFAENLDNIGFVTTESSLSVKEELKTLSPILGGLAKQNVYALPDDYFDTLTATASNDNKTAKIVRMGGGRKWWKLAAAAVVTGIILTISIQFIGNGSGAKDPVAKVQKEIKKASDTDLNEVIELMGDNTETAAVNPSDTKDLLKDIPENELKEFLQETVDADSETENPILN